MNFNGLWLPGWVCWDMSNKIHLISPCIAPCGFWWCWNLTKNGKMMDVCSIFFWGAPNFACFLYKWEWSSQVISKCFGEGSWFWACEEKWESPFDHKNGLLHDRSAAIAQNKYYKSKGIPVPPPAMPHFPKEIKAWIKGLLTTIIPMAFSQLSPRME